MLKKFLRNTSGATAIEYAMIGALLSIVIVGGATVIGTNLNSRFQPVVKALS